MIVYTVMPKLTSLSFVLLFFVFYCNSFLLYSCSSQLLGIPSNMLQEGLTHRKIEAKAEEVMKAGF